MLKHLSFKKTILLLKKKLQLIDLKPFINFTVLLAFSS